MAILISLVLLWLLLLITLYLTQKSLFHATWNEPYINETAIRIESDDWGTGASHHAQRLDGLVEMLGRHRDQAGRPAVITANMILSVPDTQKMRKQDCSEYFRRYLVDDFEDIMSSLCTGINKGIIVPQLHGIEHFYGSGFAKLARQNDPRTRGIIETGNWTDWESLDSPLQAHYIDGTQLPTSPLPEHEQREQIMEACDTFKQIFGIPSLSTVAPCYLWDDETEKIWSEHGIRYIQTAGYRCPSLDDAGHYIQDLPLIRFGERNRHGQIYLVRNAMYEPVDGRGAENCFRETRRAYRQSLPVVISTHRYNFTRSEEKYQDSLSGLDRLLGLLETHNPSLHYLSSPELGAWLAGEPDPLADPSTGKVWPPLTRQRGLQKLCSYLFRLWYRHRKLRVLAIASGLIVPLGLVTIPSRLIYRRRA